MDHASPNVLAVAVRALTGENPISLDTTKPREKLQRHAEYLLFTTATLAPPASCVDKALAGLSGEIGCLRDDDAVAEVWTIALTRALQEFATAPETWTDEVTTAFLGRAGMTFGVDDDDVLPLLRDFHARGKPSRFAVQVAVWRSPMFAYMKRVLSELPPEFDLDIDDPQESLRSLIRGLA